MKKEIILYNNYEPEKYYEETKQFLKEDNEYVSEDMIWNCIYDQVQEEWDDFSEDFKSFIENQKYGFILQGTLGLWNGNYNGGFIFDTYNELFIEKNILKDCEYWLVTDNDGELIIKGSHHDGTNNYKLKILTKEGRELIDNWEYDYSDKRTEQEIHNLIMNDEKYSTLPMLAHYLEIDDMINDISEELDY